MTRRILAALVAGPAVLLLVPGVLRAEPTTTTAPTASNGPTTSSSSSSTTSTTFGLGNYPADSAENPLQIFPHRPGAKYEDAERHANGTVTLQGSTLRETSTIEPHTALPRGSIPAKAKPYRALGLVDGYSPNVTHTAGDVLHAVVHVKPTIFPTPLTCVATVAADGTVLVPYARAQPPREKASSTSSTSSTIVPLLGSQKPFNADLYFPLGARRGRVYLTCVDSFAFLSGPDDGRAVWGLDV